MAGKRRGNLAEGRPIRSLGVVTGTRESSSPDRPRRGVASSIARYGLARLALVALITAVLVMVGVPLLVGLIVALVVALPLSLLLFGGLRRDLDIALADAGARRGAERARLRAQLRGAGASASGQQAGDHDAQGQADCGADRPDRHHHDGLGEHRDEPATSDAAQHPPER